MSTRLIEDLAHALEQMVDVTCASMRGLWLEATARERRDLVGARVEPSAVTLPLGFAKWKKARRSKYGALAMFRHAVVWRVAPASWGSASAAGRVYFAPCVDAPPFCNADLADARSAAGREALVRTREELAALIRAVRNRAADDPSWTKREVFVAGALVDRSTRSTLRDVLKLDDGSFDDLFDESAPGEV